MSQASEQITLKPPHRGLVPTTLIFCVVAFSLYVSHISGSLPYPHHVDEEAIIGPARQILVTGNFHPQEFNYPSLPRYLAAVGLAVGFIRAAPEDGVTDIQQIGSVSYPYYGVPTAVETTKQLFALFSVIGLAATAMMSWSITGRLGAVVMGLMFLMASELYFRHSWQYLNVDIVGTCFVMLTVASCLAATQRSSITRAAVIPAFWAGLAAASKYTLGLVFLPVLLGVWMYQDSDRRLASTCVSVLTVCLTFLAAVPYALLDLPAFLNGLAFDAWHYRTGHIGFDGEIGLAQLHYYANHFVNEFGLFGIGLAVIGIVAALRRDWRRTVLFFAFPVILLTLLTGQRVHFTRNVLPIHPLFAIMIGYGFVVCYELCTRWFTQLHSRLRGPLAQLAVLVGLLAVVFPTARLVDQATVTPDSRNLARDWLTQNMPAGWTVVLPSQLGFDTRALKDEDFLVDEVSITTLLDQRKLMARLEGQVVALVPIWDVDGRYDSTVSPDEINKTTAGKRVLAEFGSNPILLNYKRAPGTAWGDPQFLVIAP